MESAVAPGQAATASVVDGDSYLITQCIAPENGCTWGHLEFLCWSRQPLLVWVCLEITSVFCIGVLSHTHHHRCFLSECNQAVVNAVGPVREPSGYVSCCWIACSIVKNWD